MHPWPPPAAKGALEDELEGPHQSYSGPFVAETGLSPPGSRHARALAREVTEPGCGDLRDP